jgi:sugar phosphate permease
MSCSGLLCASIGWPYVFYISGGLGLLLAVIWMILVNNTPEEHRCASPRERHLIATSIAAGNGDHQQESQVFCFTNLVLYRSLNHY